MCSLVHACDDEKRLGFMNPTQINELELNLIINKKSETFKGISNKKKLAAIKNIIKTNQREKRSCINPHRSTIEVVRRQRMYHGPL
jgi:flagella basal body P-ring formation protein FlgA